MTTLCYALIPGRRLGFERFNEAAHASGRRRTADEAGVDIDAAQRHAAAPLKVEVERLQKRCIALLCALLEAFLWWQLRSGGDGI